MTSNRAGKSLLELAVVIGLLSVVLTIATRTIAFLMRADATGRTAVVNGTSLSRLADRFRRDAHAAIDAEVLAGNDNTPQRLRLTRSDGRVVEYRPSDASVLVVILKGQQPEKRETYRVGKGTTRFQLTQDKHPIVSLLYEKGDDASEAHKSSVAGRPRKTLRIDALRGKDHRFSQPTAQQKT